MNHTPTPWYHNYDDVLASEEPEDLIATFWHANDGKAVENAEFVVRACNAHDDLVAALSVMVERMERTGRESNLLDKAIADQSRAALAKAEAK